MTLIFAEITTDENIALLIHGPEWEVFDLFKWCVESFNTSKLDLCFMKVQRSLLTRIAANTGKVHLPEEPELLEPFYQISFLSEENLMLFKLKWIDEDTDIDKIDAVTKEI